METGFPNSTEQYIPIYWDRNYDANMVIPTVNTYPAIFFDYHEHAAHMHQVTTHIPFDNATLLINNVVMNNMEDGEEYNDERDFDKDMNMKLPTDTEPHKERLLDAIHLDDDMD